MSFDEFEEQWKGFLAAKKLKEVEGVNVRRLKIKEGIAQDERLELSEIKSLVARNRAHLGDRLKEAGRTEAAVVEYRRALAENKSAVPILNRLSDLLIRMDRDREALAILQQSGKTAPDHPVIFSQLGRIHLKLENFPAAREALRTAIEINPFSPEVHRNLAEACEKLGDLETAGRERAVAERIKQ
jgi:tetratricopeptide (TPR) repeat protein